MDNSNNPKTPLVIPQEIRQYLESLIAEANVAVFDEKTKEDLVQYLFERLDKFLAAKIVENMTLEDTDVFIKMNQDQKPREEIDAYLKEHMKDPQEVFTRAFIDFRDFYLTAQNPSTSSGSSTTQNAPAVAAPAQNTTEQSGQNG